MAEPTAIGEVLSQTSPDSVRLSNDLSQTCPDSTERPELPDQSEQVWKDRNRHAYWRQFWADCGISPLHRKSVPVKIDMRGGKLVAAASAAVAYCQQSRLRRSVYLHGPVGCGKTLIASKILYLIAGNICRRHDEFDLWYNETMPPTLRLVSLPRLLADIRSTFNGEGSSAHVVDEYRCADVLVLDDIGAEKPSEWVRDTLFQIIDWRYGRDAATIFTSNCSLRELAERLSERITDRILEMCHDNIIEIQCGSYRGKVGT